MFSPNCSEDRTEKFYWGSDDLFIPVYKKMQRAFDAHPDARILVNFASYRAAYEVTLETLACKRDPVEGQGPPLPRMECVAIIAEGIPERFSRDLVHKAKKQGVLIIGPATVSPPVWHPRRYSACGFY